MAERGRFAPTPSGRMHLGNVFSALLAWLSVRATHGELVLRIEDLDTLRCSAENAEILKDDLRWLGLTWDAEQPDQSTRSEYYESILDRLRGDGFVYPCWCTRGDLKNAANAPHASDGHPIYPGTCRDLTEEERAAKAKVRAPLWRLRVPDESRYNAGRARARSSLFHAAAAVSLPSAQRRTAGILSRPPAHRAGRTAALQARP